MKNYFLVLKILLINMFRRGGERKSKYMWIVYIILGFSVLIVAVSLGIGVYAMAPLFNDPNVLITYLFIIAFFLVIFFSLFSMLAYLYFAKDTEFFLSLPVKPSVIYFAKLTLVYMIELLIVLLVLVPSLAMIGVSLSLGPIYFITMFFAIFIVPAFPLVFTSVIAIPLMYVVSYLKSKTALSSAIIIILFTGLMAAYMFFMINMQTDAATQTDAGFEALIDSFENAFAVWGSIFYPFLCLSRFATGTVSFSGLGSSMLINISVFLGAAAVLFILAVIISNSVYRRGAAKNLENSVSKKAKGENVKRSVIKSLMMQEWKELYRNPTYAFQCLSFVLLCPVMTLIMLLMVNKPSSGGEGLNFGFMWLIACALISFLGVGTNVAAQTAITRQGSAFYYSKIIPIDYKIQIKAKIILYNIISFGSVILSVIVASVLLQAWWVGLIMTAYLIVLNYAASCFAVFFDLKDPKLNWVTYTEAVKQNKNVMINTLINMSFVIVFTGVSFVAYLLLMTVVGSVAAILIAFAILVAAAAGVSVLFHNILFSNIDKYYSRLS